MRRNLSRVEALLVLLAAGCVPVGYAYPTFSDTQLVGTGAAPGEVFAFRVDELNEQHSCVYASFVLAEPTWTVVTRTTLALLPSRSETVVVPLPGDQAAPPSDGKTAPQSGGQATPQPLGQAALPSGGKVETESVTTVAPQQQVALTTARIWFGLSGCKDQTIASHRLLVRLYRRGYGLIEVPADHDVGLIRWQRAHDLPTQEKAIDDLLGGGPCGSADPGPAERVPGVADLEFARTAIAARESYLWRRVLAPGPDAPEHRQALLFAADEYERLAGAPECDPAQGQRLRAKVEALRELAGLLPPSNAPPPAPPPVGQGEVVAAIQKMGGKVVLDRDGHSVLVADLHGLPVSDALVGPLGSLKNARTLNLYGTGLGDATLRRLRGAADLRELNLNATRVTDDGLASLASLPALVELGLNNTRVSDSGLAHLSGLAKLEELALLGTHVTDEGLATVAGLKNLKKLTLGGRAVSDRGLAHLKGLRKLSMLVILNTRVTNAGVRDLQAALPDIRVAR